GKMGGQKLSVEQISGHNTPQDCWIVVDNQVWHVTDFLDEHPGGSTSRCQCLQGQTGLMNAVILKYAGRDATKAYSEVHTPRVIKTNLPPEKNKGILDESTVNEEWAKEPQNVTPAVIGEKPPLQT